ncbi:MAG TPA: hypothetical protein VM536_01795, partial [Chloroflexia bacterium]|nr:hypothetical protein [Chloroflexia bacterium]
MTTQPSTAPTNGASGSTPAPPQFDTLAVHAGQRVDLAGATPTTVPIYASSTFLGDSADALE